MYICICIYTQGYIYYFTLLKQRERERERGPGLVGPSNHGGVVLLSCLLLVVLLLSLLSLVVLLLSLLLSFLNRRQEIGFAMAGWQHRAFYYFNVQIQNSQCFANSPMFFFDAEMKFYLYIYISLSLYIYIYICMYIYIYIHIHTLHIIISALFRELSRLS